MYDYVYIHTCAYTPGCSRGNAKGQKCTSKIKSGLSSFLKLAREPKAESPPYSLLTFLDRFWMRIRRRRTACLLRKAAAALVPKYRQVGTLPRAHSSVTSIWNCP